MELLCLGFLTGGMPELALRDFAVLTAFAVLFLTLAYGQCAKRIRK